MKKLSLIVLSIVGCLFTISCNIYGLQSDSVDLVVFSFNRPLQLYAFLESTKQCITGLGEQHVIYRASDIEFQKGYDQLQQAFPEVKFHLQGSNPRSDFKPLTLKTTFESPSSYVVFAVDDIVIKNTVSLSECVKALEKHNAYGFYLRLGKNLTQCYPYGGRAQSLPPLQKEEQDVFSWKFNQGALDWGYPHTVDMTIYRKKDIEADMRTMQYYAPNRLEGLWHNKAGKIMHKKGLCYSDSKIVNLPLNRVQNENNNRAMTEYSAKDLLTIFLDGKKMDIAPLKSIDNKGAHMEYSPTFITR